MKAHYGVVAGDPAPLKGKRLALWGLAFKANTDDIRESMALELIDGLLALGAEVVVHDFEAMPPVKAKIGDRVTYAADPMEAATGADALLIATEWAQYKAADLNALAKVMTSKVMFDGRNLFRPESMAKAGWAYQSIGRRAVSGA